MTTVSIFAVPNEEGGSLYQAVAGTRNVCGATPGEALDAIRAQLEGAEASTLVVLRQNLPDSYFTARARDRLSELMQRWRTARDAGACLPADDQAELDALVEAELRGSAARANYSADQLAELTACE